MHQHVSISQYLPRLGTSVLLLGYGERNYDRQIKGMGKEHGSQEEWR